MSVAGIVKTVSKLNISHFLKGLVGSLVKKHGLAFIFFSLLFSYDSNGDSVERCTNFSKLSQSNIQNLLNRGGFSGAVGTNVSLALSGCFGCGESEIGVYFYQYFWGNHRVSMRLIFISNLEGYLGMYPVPDKPTNIIGHDIFFPFESSVGNVISIEGGVFPEEAYLDGELFLFFQ